jgi:hypothetical protein
MTVGNTAVHRPVAIGLCKMFSHHKRKFSVVKNLSFSLLFIASSATNTPNRHS